MQKKNMIIVVSDAFREYFVNKRIGDEFVCPFLHALSERNIYCSNMYSQAPYTMSAIQPLLSGKNVMDVNSYDMSLSNDERLVFHYFLDEGYRLYMTDYGSLFTPKDILENGKHFFMELNWSISSIKPFLLHYIEKIENGESDKDQYFTRLNDCIRKAFESICAFYGCETANIDNIFLLSDDSKLPDYDLRKKFSAEYEKYKDNGAMYVEEVIKTKEKHPFFSLDRGLEPEFKNSNDLRAFYKKYRKVFRKIKLKQVLVNCLNSEVPIKDSINVLLSRDNKKTGRANKDRAVNFYQRIHLGSLSYDEYIRDNYRGRGIPSADYQLNKLFSVIKDDNKEESPFICYAHLMDTHQPFNFFTGEDITKADSEMKLMIKLAKRLGTRDYKGNLSYLLSARYVDLCIERFVKNMDEAGLLKNSVLIFTADHGLPYGDSPLRSLIQGDNYHYESYHVPLIIADYVAPKNFKINKAVSSIDFVPTVLNLAGINTEVDCKGKCILDEYDRGYSCMEWLGSGTPDWLEKPIIYGIRNNDLLLVIKVMTMDDVGWENVEAVYDLQLDPHELKNVKEEYKDNPLVNEFLQMVAKRHKEVQILKNVG